MRILLRGSSPITYAFATGFTHKIGNEIGVVTLHTARRILSPARRGLGEFNEGHCEAFLAFDYGKFPTARLIDFDNFLDLCSFWAPSATSIRFIAGEAT